MRGSLVRIQEGTQNLGYMTFQYNYDSYLISNNNQKNKKYFFNSTDTFEKYEKNSKNLSWYYCNKEIQYNYNSFGYRTKEFEDLNNDYFISFGCSNTEGIGLEQNTIWCELLSIELNLDLFNLGMGSSGIDFQYMNTVILQKKIIETGKKPKLVVYLWPSQERTCFGYYENGFKNIDIITPNYVKSQHTIKNNFYEWYKVGHILNEGEKHRQNYFSILSSNLIWKSLGIPVINLTYDETLLNFKNDLIEILTIEPEKNDFSRDLCHFGIKTQQKIKNVINKEIGRVVKWDTR